MTNLYRDLDAIVVGGGCAGLFTAVNLLQRGLKCLLLTPQNDGFSQTRLCQGIIHSGIKYKFYSKDEFGNNVLSQACHSWDRYLDGQEINLKKVKLLSNDCILWSSNIWDYFFTRNIVKNVLQARISKLNNKAVNTQLKKVGAVFSINEKIIDTSSLLKELTQHIGDNKLEYSTPPKLNLSNDGSISSLSLNTGKNTIELQAKSIIFCAGNGNQDYHKALSKKEIRYQNRPLTMVTVTGDLPLVNGHLIGKGGVLATITTTDDEEERHWQIGGKVAETSGELYDHEIRAFIQNHFRDIDIHTLKIGFKKIERSEGFYNGNRLPDNYIIEQEKNAYFCWPTKLVLSPVMAKDICHRIEQEAYS
ncbi:FAD-dependent oxidoreductase [Vibrio splendidus]